MRASLPGAPMRAARCGREYSASRLIDRGVHTKIVDVSMNARKETS
ncbi:conserved hypothetical protein [Actinomyces sp. oral taxon 180 str. F0310]|nr:conserved hypothetical protein [Actinomyces sp. oral taxon 180 str. F0310]